MKLTYNLEPLKITTITSLPGAWDADKYRKLLSKMEYDDTGDASESDLKELCCMALTDLDPEEAAAVVLGFLLDKDLKQGQIQNLSNEMLEEKLWEEYSDLSLHEQFFNAHQILYDAFQKSFPRPEALKFQLRLNTRQARDLEAVKENPEPVLIRLLVQGMPENTKIKRLYEDQLESGPFEDAKHILWQLNLSEEHPSALLIEGISSQYWFNDLKQFSALDVVLEID